MNGQSNGVVSFVNTRRDVHRQSPNAIVYRGRLVWTGEKWQCVEYVRRYLLQTRGITFSSVPNAYAMSSLRSMWNLAERREVPVRWFHCSSSHSPRRGDILILRDGATGHVGMVHAVMDEDANWLAIADQNYEYGRYWQHPSFAYILSRSHPDVLGWLRVL